MPLTQRPARLTIQVNIPRAEQLSLSIAQSGMNVRYTARSGVGNLPGPGFANTCKLHWYRKLSICSPSLFPQELVEKVYRVVMAVRGYYEVAGAGAGTPDMYSARGVGVKTLRTITPRNAALPTMSIHPGLNMSARTPLAKYENAMIPPA